MKKILFAILLALQAYCAFSQQTIRTPQDSIFAEEYGSVSKAYFTTIIKKDTSWVSERRTQSMGGVNRSGVFQTLPGYRIINVEFTCKDAPNANGSACPWNYNPLGGYS